MFHKITPDEILQTATDKVRELALSNTGTILIYIHIAAYALFLFTLSVLSAVKIF